MRAGTRHRRAAAQAGDAAAAAEPTRAAAARRRSAAGDTIHVDAQNGDLVFERLEAPFRPKTELKKAASKPIGVFVRLRGLAVGPMLIACTLPPAALVFWTRERSRAAARRALLPGRHQRPRRDHRRGPVPPRRLPRAHNSRTIIVSSDRGSGMAALLAVHEPSSAQHPRGPNSVITLTGAATLAVGAAVLALSRLRPLVDPHSIPKVIALSAKTIATATDHQDAGVISVCSSHRWCLYDACSRITPLEG